MFLKSLRSSAGADDTSHGSGGALQDELMRFEGRFSARLVTAFAPLVDSSDPAIRVRAATDQLKFISSALDIAVGAAPEVNVLDMVTLVALGRDVMASRWSVDLHGDDGRGVGEAFEASLDDIIEIARRATSEDVEAELRRVIQQWKVENPNEVDVTPVRLSAYAAHAPGASTQGARDAAGLFSVVRGAARTADTALLLGERALYAVQRLPFLMRTHARVGGSELFADLMRNIDGLDVAEATQGAASRARAIGDRVERSLDRLLAKAVVACAGIAIVTATSWLFARLAYHRLTARW